MHAARWGVPVGTILLLAFASPAFAQGKGRAVYIHGTVTTIVDGSKGPVDLTDGQQLVFAADEGGRLEVPWAVVEQVEYGQKVRRRVLGAVLLSPWLLFAKKREHYVTLSWQDADGSAQSVTFQLDKNDIRSALSLIMLRTRRDIVYLDEEARRHVGAGGRDVTRELVADAAPRDSGRVKSLPHKRSPSSLRGVLLVDGGFDAPLGEYYARTTGGAGFGARLLLPLTDDLALCGTVSRLGIEFGPGVPHERIIPISGDYSTSAISLQAGIAYYRNVPRGGPWPDVWHLDFSAGAIRYHLRRAIAYREPRTGDTLTFSDTGSDAKFATAQSAGAIWKLNRQVALGLSGDVLFVWTSDSHWTDSYAVAEPTSGFSIQLSTFKIKGYVLRFRVGLAHVW